MPPRRVRARGRQRRPLLAVCSGRDRRRSTPLVYGAAVKIPVAVAQLIESAPIAHGVTLNADGSPQVSLAWVGIEDEEIVIGTIPDQAKLRNIRRGPRVAISMVNGNRNAYGLDEYVVLHGHARLTEGGAAELLQRLARVYLGRRAVPTDAGPASRVGHPHDRRSDRGDARGRSRPTSVPSARDRGPIQRHRLV